MLKFAVNTRVLVTTSLIFTFAPDTASPGTANWINNLGSIQTVTKELFHSFQVFWGGQAPLDFEILHFPINVFAKNDCFSVSNGKKKIYHFRPSPTKICGFPWKNPLLPPCWKNPSGAHEHTLACSLKLESVTSSTIVENTCSLSCLARCLSKQTELWFH